MSDDGTKILTDTHALLSAGFCQRKYATDDTGRDTHWKDPGATCFCLLGGLRRAAQQFTDGEVRQNAYNDACNRLIAQIPPKLRYNLSDGEYETLTKFSDRKKTVRPVLTLLRKAIAAGEGFSVARGGSA